MLRVFIPKERAPGETRVAATPETVKAMVKEGVEVIVESGAGSGPHIPDLSYEAAGARLSRDPVTDWAAADLVLKVAAPQRREVGAIDEMRAFKPGAILIGFLAPHRNLEMVRTLAGGEVSAFAMELIPRISRAQSMDALSSQASIAGYKAIILAAGHLGKYFPLLITAAGTVPPAKVLVIGAGVAGLQAIATAKRLGATIDAFDLRPAVKEEVESLGARFHVLPGFGGNGGSGQYAREVGEALLKKQQEVLRPLVSECDAAICTAQVPGRPSPTLITNDMVDGMRPGSVIVDLAVEQGGNCEGSELGRDVIRHGVVIIGHPNLAATMPYDASVLFSRNVFQLMRHLIKDQALHLDLNDEITRAALLTHQGKVLHQPTIALLEGGF